MRKKKQTASRLTDGEPLGSAPVLEEMAVLPGLGEVIGVRSAKAHLSGLLDWVASGHEVTITSGGEPKARIVPFSKGRHRVPFQGSEDHLRTMPSWKGGPTADEIIRADRDGRGW